MCWKQHVKSPCLSLVLSAVHAQVQGDLNCGMWETTMIPAAFWHMWSGQLRWTPCEASLKHPHLAQSLAKDCQRPIRNSTHKLASHTRQRYTLWSHLDHFQLSWTLSSFDGLQLLHKIPSSCRLCVLRLLFSQMATRPWKARCMTTSAAKAHITSQLKHYKQNRVSPLGAKRCACGRKNMKNNHRNTPWQGTLWRIGLTLQSPNEKQVWNSILCCKFRCVKPSYVSACEANNCIAILKQIEYGIGRCGYVD